MVLTSADPDTAAQFYRSVFGWERTPVRHEYGGYADLLSDGLRVAGIEPCHAEMGDWEGWRVFFATPDLVDTCAAAVAGGARVLAPAMTVGSLGSMAVLADPASGTFGLWQAREHTGFQRFAERGAATWFELLTEDFATAVNFYGTVFGWSIQPMSDTDDFRYSTAAVGAQPVAGFLAADETRWNVYIEVADVDEVCAEVRKHGGVVVRDPADSPFGRVAAICDPTGAQCTVLSRPQED